MGSTRYRQTPATQIALKSTPSRDDVQHVGSARLMTPATGDQAGASTPGQDEARRTITRTTITPAPGTEVAAAAEPKERSLRLRRESSKTGRHGELMAARPPLPGTNVLRAVLAVQLVALCLVTVAGAALVMLLWQQDRTSGVLTTQIDRAWELFGHLRNIERWVAFTAVAVGVLWIALATINVRRATGIKRSPLAALSLPIGVAGVWFVGANLVADTDDTLAKAAGIVLQAVFAAIPLLALERVAEAAEARHRPLRITYLAGVGYLVALQTSGAVSTIDDTADATRWGRLGAYLVIAALVQVLAALAATEACRAIEDGTRHRFEMRNRFGESLLTQAAIGA